MISHSIKLFESNIETKFKDIRKIEQKAKKIKSTNELPDPVQPWKGEGAQKLSLNTVQISHMKIKYLEHRASCISHTAYHVLHREFGFSHKIYLFSICTFYFLDLLNKRFEIQIWLHGWKSLIASALDMRENLELYRNFTEFYPGLRHCITDASTATSTTLEWMHFNFQC